MTKKHETNLITGPPNPKLLSPPVSRARSPTTTAIPFSELSPADIETRAVSMTVILQEMLKRVELKPHGASLGGV
jgi:hypothetical protein